MGMHWSSQLAYDETCAHRRVEPVVRPDLAGFGFLPGTIVMTATGPKLVERLCEGDLVDTFETGFQPVQGLIVRAQRMARSEVHLPFFVPEGVLGNELSLILPPNVAVVMESDRLEETTGDPFVTVPIVNLDGLAGIHRTLLRNGSPTLTLCLPEPALVNLGCGAYVSVAEAGPDAAGDLIDQPALSPLDPAPRGPAGGGLPG